MDKVWLVTGSASGLGRNIAEGVLESGDRLPSLPKNLPGLHEFLDKGGGGNLRSHALPRNELGHPRETPPNIDRKDAFVNLQIFPRYYETAEQVRQFLASNQV